MARRKHLPSTAESVAFPRRLLPSPQLRREGLLVAYILATSRMVATGTQVISSTLSGV